MPSVKEMIAECHRQADADARAEWEANPNRTDHYAALALRQTTDRSALVMLAERLGGLFKVLRVEWFAPGTPFADIAGRAAEVYGDRQIVWSGYRNLVVDGSVVGPGLVMNAFAATGLEYSNDYGIYETFKVRELTGNLQMLLQSRRLSIPADVEGAGDLTEELKRFQVDVGGDIPAALAALMLAVWDGEYWRLWRRDTQRGE